MLWIKFCEGIKEKVGEDHLFRKWEKYGTFQLELKVTTALQLLANFNHIILPHASSKFSKGAKFTGLFHLFLCDIFSTFACEQLLVCPYHF